MKHTVYAIACVCERERICGKSFSFLFFGKCPEKQHLRAEEYICTVRQDGRKNKGILLSLILLSHISSKDDILVSNSIPFCDPLTPKAKFQTIFIFHKP